MAKPKYYSIKSFLARVPDAHYYMVIGERSNGKTYSILEYVLERYVRFGEEFVYIRRFDEDIKYKRGSQIFENLINNKAIEKMVLKPTQKQNKKNGCKNNSDNSKLVW